MFCKVIHFSGIKDYFHVSVVNCEIPLPLAAHYQVPCNPQGNSKEAPWGISVDFMKRGENMTVCDIKACEGVDRHIDMLTGSLTHPDSQQRLR